MAYRHPGQAFLSLRGPLQAEAEVREYADFLRQTAGLDVDPPVDLAGIYACFGMPIPRRAPLGEQQGILVDGDRGLILIKEDDPLVRQRFTEGHELMELLFEAQYQQPTGLQPDPERKEQLCDRGAAELLMPLPSFEARLRNLGLSLSTGRLLAQQYQTSLLATLVRMMQCGEGSYCLVMWRWHGQDQKLRVWWRSPTVGWTGAFIPKNKSAPEGSVIGLAQQFNQVCSGTERLAFGTTVLQYYVEAMPVMMGRQAAVLSLLQCLE